MVNRYSLEYVTLLSSKLSVSLEVKAYILFPFAKKNANKFAKSIIFVNFVTSAEPLCQGVTINVTKGKS